MIKCQSIAIKQKLGPDFAKCHFYDFDFDGDRKVPAGTHGPNIRQHI